jgi:hypothetical protein
MAVDQYTISAVSTARDLAPVMYCLHELVGRLPVTARSRDRPGIRIEEGKTVDEHYSGPVLEDVLAGNTVRKTTPSGGPYRGIPVVVAPVRDENGEAIAAVGIVDVTGIFDIAGLMEQYTTIRKQVCGADPCPLPTESTAAKR